MSVRVSVGWQRGSLRGETSVRDEAYVSKSWCQNVYGLVCFFVACQPLSSPLNTSSAVCFACSGHVEVRGVLSPAVLSPSSPCCLQYLLHLQH